MVGEAFVAASSRGETPTHRGNRDARLVPQGCYRSAGDDMWLVVSVRSDAEWQRTAEIIGRPDLAVMPWEERLSRHDELDVAIEAWSSTLAQQEAAERLQAVGVPASAVSDTAAIRADPQLVHRNFYVEVANAKMRPYRQTGPTWHLVDAPPHEMVHSPWFGEHNDSILRDLLGRSDEQIAELEEAEVISTAPVNPTVG